MCDFKSISIYYMADNEVSTKNLHYLLATPDTLFKEFCETYQNHHEGVQFSTIFKNTTMRATFLHHYYEMAIQPYNSHSQVENDEEYTALLSFYTYHMTNTANSTNPSHFHDGKKSNQTNRDARNASFQYCMELIPTIQKKLKSL